MRSSTLLAVALLSLAASAQTPVTRNRIELDAVGLIPASGWKVNDYSAGPGLRLGDELRLHRFLAFDAGWTAAWMPGSQCSRYGCDHPTYQNQWIDYGLRGVLPLAHSRVELSLGVGGGYIRFDKASGDNYYNGALFQYSGKATIALNRSGTLRAGATIRTWRDLGRPIQQWISTSAGISYGFGSLR